MKKQTVYFILAFLVILLSVPLGREAAKIIYLNKNLASEYIHLVKSFIDSFKLMGLLLLSWACWKHIKDHPIRGGYERN